MLNKILPSYNELFIPIIMEGQKLGQVVKTDPVKLATAFYSMINGTAFVLMMAKDLPDDPISLPDVETLMNIFKNHEVNDECNKNRITKPLSIS